MCSRVHLYQKWAGHWAIQVVDERLKHLFQTKNTNCVFFYFNIKQTGRAFFQFRILHFSELKIPKNDKHSFDKQPSDPSFLAFARCGFNSSQKKVCNKQFLAQKILTAKFVHVPFFKSRTRSKGAACGFWCHGSLNFCHFHPFEKLLQWDTTWTPASGLQSPMMIAFPSDMLEHLTL